MQKKVKYNHEKPSRFVYALVGPEGAMSFTVTTGWDTLIKGADTLGIARHAHSRAADKTGPLTQRRPCDLLPGGECYLYQNWDTLAFRVLEKFIAEGEDLVWIALQRLYEQEFMAQLQTR